tara:strand:+ start:119 stop:556 length:438 start_codon:yes stop_codon:yes gene_type:complete
MNMKTSCHPLNVVIFLASGEAENYECAGPIQLKEWMTEGRVSSDTRLYDRRAQRWLTANEYLKSCRERTQLQELDDLDCTLTDLMGVAEELKRISEIMGGKADKNDGQGNLSEHWQAERTDGNAHDDNANNNLRVLSPNAGAYAH